MIAEVIAASLLRDEPLPEGWERADIWCGYLGPGDQRVGDYDVFLAQTPYLPQTVQVFVYPGGRLALTFDERVLALWRREFAIAVRTSVEARNADEARVRDAFLHLLEVAAHCPNRQASTSSDDAHIQEAWLTVPPRRILARNG